MAKEPPAPDFHSGDTAARPAAVDAANHDRDAQHVELGRQRVQRLVDVGYGAVGSLTWSKVIVVGAMWLGANQAGLLGAIVAGIVVGAALAFRRGLRWIALVALGRRP